MKLGNGFMQVIEYTEKFLFEKLITVRPNFQIINSGVGDLR